MDCEGGVCLSWQELAADTAGTLQASTMSIAAPTRPWHYGRLRRPLRGHPAIIRTLPSSDALSVSWTAPFPSLPLTSAMFVARPRVRCWRHGPRLNSSPPCPPRGWPPRWPGSRTATLGSRKFGLSPSGIDIACLKLPRLFVDTNSQPDYTRANPLFMAARDYRFDGAADTVVLQQIRRLPMKEARTIPSFKVSPRLETILEAGDEVDFPLLFFQRPGPRLG